LLIFYKSLADRNCGSGRGDTGSLALHSILRFLRRLELFLHLKNDLLPHFGVLLEHGVSPVPTAHLHLEAKLNFMLWHHRFIVCWNVFGLRHQTLTTNLIHEAFSRTRWLIVLQPWLVMMLSHDIGSRVVEDADGLLLKWLIIYVYLIFKNHGLNYFEMLPYINKWLLIWHLRTGEAKWHRHVWLLLLRFPLCIFMKYMQLRLVLLHVRGDRHRFT